MNILINVDFFTFRAALRCWLLELMLCSRFLVEITAASDQN